MARQSVAERFWAKVDRSSDPSACWNWKASCNHKGYGIFWFDGTMGTAHRYSHILHVGPIPSGMCVCHTCDNPKCVNPGHLWLGTSAENTKDRDKKGRQVAIRGEAWQRAHFAGLPRGDNHYTKLRPERIRLGEATPNAKLTDDDIRDIRARRNRGESQQSIANAYGVTQVAISAIDLRKTWGHVV